MTERQITFLNKVIDVCINCGGDIRGPYWTHTESTFEVISDFIFSFSDNLAVKYFPFWEFRIYKLEEEG